MAMGANGSAAWQAYKKGAFFANPSFVQIHPTCIPVHGNYQSKLTLMSESLRNDGRIWVPKKKEDAEALRNKTKKPSDLAEEDRDYYLERRYPAFGNLVPRDVASRAAKERCDGGFGVGSGLAVYLDFADSIKRLGKKTIEERYGNLFQMYEKIVDDNPYRTPMMIYPAIHYCMGGLWVDYHMMTTIPGLFAIGECNFSDHGANRLGASALMQGLADGYFILPYTLQHYLADEIMVPRMPVTSAEFEQAESAVRERIHKLFAVKGKQSVDVLHRKSGLKLWELVGMGRSKSGLESAVKEFAALKEEFWHDVVIPGSYDEINPELEKAGRVADFIEMGELMARDALQREESCGGHFREEFQSEDGEARRDDEHFMFVAAWEYKGPDHKDELHKEPLVYENIKVQTRNYKS
jgi:succinate dehydrogenase / fumarate reductase flavoprotein subunit